MTFHCFTWKRIVLGQQSHKFSFKPTHSTDAYALNTSRHLRETIVTSTLATLYAAVIPHMNTFNDDS
jgi:hypothetical protein